MPVTPSYLFSGLPANLPEFRRLAILSFHPVKTIATGEGGAILTNDSNLAECLRKLANPGIERNPSKFVHIGKDI